MSQAEELLNSLSDERVITEHTHTVVDPDSYFIIDPDTRQMSNASGTSNVLMQYDHGSECYTFELPRYVEGHDMTLCNRVRVHFNNVDGKTNETTADVAEMYDLATKPDDDTKIISSWTIYRNATQRAGTLNFLVQYMCVADNGDVVYEWHTDIYTDVTVKAGRNNGEQTVIEYSNVLEQWYQKIFGAGDNVLENIADAGEEQLITIANEGETQKEAIALKGEETLKTIPEDYTTTYNMAEEALRKKANAIVLDAAGETIFVNDSSDAYLLGLNVYGKTTQVTTTGKNLFDVTKIINNSRVTNNNGVITVATPEGSSAVDSMVDLGVAAPHLEVGKKYTLTFETTGTDRYIYLEEAKFMWNNGASYEVTQEMLDSDILFYASGVSTTATLTNIMFRDAAIVDGTYEPYTGGLASPNPDYSQELASVEKPTVSVYGKNLIRNDVAPGTSETKYGMTFTHNVDKSICVSGTPTQAVAYNIMEDAFLPAGTYCLSGAPDNASTMFRLQVNYKPTIDGTEKTGGANMETPVKFTIPYDGYVRAYIYASASLGPITGTFYPQLERGSTATEYEPYEPVQPLAINRTLSGIPVSSGGNYTDVNGQQWICDEVDLARGVYVKRITAKTVDGSISYQEAGTQIDGTYTAFVSFPSIWIKETDCFVSDIFQCYSGENYSTSDAEGVYSNPGTTNCNLIILRVDNSRATDMDTFMQWITEHPCTVYCPLKEPIETALTEEEIAHYKKLMTNYHNTTVVNDKGAHMAIKYAADTEIYLRDNQPKPTDEQIQAAVNEYASQNGVQVPSDDHIRAIVDEVLGGIVNDEY